MDWTGALPRRRPHRTGLDSVERAMRPVVRSHLAARTICSRAVTRPENRTFPASLIETCKLNNVNSYPSGEHRGNWSGGLACHGIWSLPVPRKQLIYQTDRVLGDVSQDVGQPGLRVDVVHLGADDQAVHHRGPLSALI